jgi:hypothetical protein
LKANPFLRAARFAGLLLEGGRLIDLASDGFITAREISEYVKGQNVNMSDTKIGRELSKLGLTKDVKKIGGKATNIWKGIRKAASID